eukprot:364352-Chlamydomonas_euryale.AAC.1
MRGGVVGWPSVDKEEVRTPVASSRRARGSWATSPPSPPVARPAAARGPTRGRCDACRRPRAREAERRIERRRPVPRCRGAPSLCCSWPADRTNRARGYRWWGWWGGRGRTGSGVAGQVLRAGARVGEQVRAAHMAMRMHAWPYGQDPLMCPEAHMRTSACALDGCRRAMRQMCCVPMCVGRDWRYQAGGQAKTRSTLPWLGLL